MAHLTRTRTFILGALLLGTLFKGALCDPPTADNNDASRSDDDDEDTTVVDELDLVLVASLLAVPAAMGAVLFKYSDASQNGAASVALLLLAACAAVGMIAVFPTDVAAALGAERGDGVPEDQYGPTLRKVYRALYWVAMALNFFLLPSMEMIIRSGGFGLKARLADASGQIAKLAAGIAAPLAVLTLVVCAVNDDWEGSVMAKLGTSAVALSNTLGLVNITLLLGFGLVELPRSLWRGADPTAALALARLSVVAEYRARDDARTALSLALDDAYRYKALADASLNRALREELQAAVQELLEQDFALFAEEEHRRARNRAVARPAAFTVDPKRAGAFEAVESASSGGKWISPFGKGRKRDDVLFEPLPMAELVAFRAQAKQQYRALVTADARVDRCERVAWEAEDVLRARGQATGRVILSIDRPLVLGRVNSSSALGPGLGAPLLDQPGQGDHPPPPSLGAGSESGNRAVIVWWDGGTSGGLSFHWHVTWRPVAARACALALGCLSVLVVGSEALSLAAALRDQATDQAPLGTASLSPTLVALAVTGLLGYGVGVLSWSAASMATSRENLLVPGRATSALALSYYARFGLGNAAPLLFYTTELLFPHVSDKAYDGAGSQTAFFQVYGKQVLLNSIAKDVAVFFPLSLLALVLFQACGVLPFLYAKVGYGVDDPAESKAAKDELECQRGANRLATRRRQVTNLLSGQRRIDAYSAIGSGKGGGSGGAASSKGAPEYVPPPRHTKAALPKAGGGDGLYGESPYGGDMGRPGRSNSGMSLKSMILDAEAGGGGVAGSGSNDDDDGNVFSFRKSGEAGRKSGDGKERDDRRKSGADASGKAMQDDAREAAAVAKASPRDQAAEKPAADKPRSDAARASANAAEHLAPGRKSGDGGSQKQQRVARCFKCGEVLPKEMDTVDPSNQTCTGCRERDAARISGSSVAAEATAAVSIDRLGGALTAFSIENAFTCPQCFSGFSSQQAVLDHFKSGTCPARDKDDDDDDGNGRGSGGSGLGRGSGDERPGSAGRSSGDGGRKSGEGRKSGDRGGRWGSAAQGAPLSGWVEKHNRVKGWQRRWFLFDAASGQLQYFKYLGEDGKAFKGSPAMADMEIRGVVDLRYVEEVVHKPGDMRRVDLIAGPERTYKLKLATASEGKHWREQLLTWRAHLMDA